MTDEAIVEQFIAGVEEINNTLVNGGEDGFSVDFQKIKQQSAALKQNPSYKSTVGEHIDNKKKNRYKDILPFDTLRPKLPLWDGCTSDYINASLIKGPDGNHSYLASQGPLPHTVDDFWRLLWSFKVKVIVMVCREVEMGKRKCENYWSSDKNAVQDFGEISVKLEEDELNENGFHKRRISAKRGNETRTFHQLHYRNWPDHGVPKNRGEILSIIAMARTLQDYSQDKENPLCVHCSAGCGRTGAVLVIDYFRNLLLHKNLKSSMKVFDVVTAMRKQRPAIVQTKDQYEFVHLAVSELFANYLLSKGRTVSGLGKALTSTNYENITITPKAKREKKTSHRTDPQSSGKLQNNYQNIQLDHNTGKSPSSKTVASPDSLVPPPKPSRREGSLLQRPVSSIEPLTHHQTKQNMTNFRGYPENKKKMTDSSSLNAATGSLARTNSSSKDSISKHANLSNAAPAHDVDQRSSYPTPLLKPKPKLRSSSGSNTTRPENSSASESTKPGCSTTTKPAPPLKPKRTFKKNRSPNVQKNQPVKDDKDQDRNDSEIFINSNPDYVGSRPKSSAVPSSPNQNALSSPSSPSLSKFPAPSSTSEMPPLPKRTPESYMLSPAEDTLDTADNCAPESCAPQLTVPERTPQSYILETEDETITCESQKKNNGKKILLDIPLTSEYAEVGFPTQPAEVAVRPSAANQSSNLGAKAKEFLYKTSNLFGGSSNSKVEDAAKSSHPAIHETNEDLSFPHRLSRKPKGPKPLPKVWSSK